MNLPLLLDMAADGFGARVAVGSHSHGLTYEELRTRAVAGAEYLRTHGFQHLAYVGASSAAFPVALFASAVAGIPLLPLNYRLGADQLQALLAAHDNVLVVSESAAEQVPLGGSLRHLSREEWLAATAGTVKGLDGGMSVDAEAVALLLYTSGTTAAPKAAILRHRHLVSYIFGSVEFGAAGEDEAVLVSVPTYHIAGVTNLLSNLYQARRIVYLDAFTPDSWLDVVRQESITHAMVVPTMLARVVDHIDRQGGRTAGTPTLRSVAYGGARMPMPVITRALELFATTDFVNAYGLTETSSTIAVLGPEEHRAAIAVDDPDVRARLGSAGQVIPGVEIDIRGPDGSLGPAQVGELWVRGEQVSGEYVARHSPLDSEGWFPTRDRGYLDAAGYLFIEGRTDDTIIRGGENIAPAEIEDVLIQHPGVADVAVVGPPDDEWGQRIVAVVVPQAGATVDLDELKEWVRSRLRTSKTPDDVIAWPELPHTETGKLLRREILADLSLR